MYAEVILVILLGICCGCFSGLLVGVHVNMISVFLLSNVVSLLDIFSLNALVVFIIVMSLTHTFINFIPSCLFGIPDSDNIMSILPAHSMVLEGRGREAIYLSSVGSLISIIFVLIISFPFYFSLKWLYASFKPFIPYFLVILILFMIALEREKNRIYWSLLIVLFSGGYGMLILNSSMLNDPLLILFSGVFGVSSIFLSLNSKNSKLPTQNEIFSFKFDRSFVKTIGISGISASLCSITPGIGSSQAAILSSLFMKIKSEMFIVATSSINTINFVLSILTFHLIDRSRNGSIYVISQIVTEISLFDVLFYFFIVFITSIVVFYLTILIGDYCIKIISRLNFKKINFGILVFLFVLIYLMTGLIGILATVGAACLGVLCVSLDVRRVHLMNVLLVPVIMNLI